MDRRTLPTGMYVIDKNYKIVACNQAVTEIYPDVKVGDFCHKALALSDMPCENCPLLTDNALFYNPIRGEWIYANAAEMEFPGHGHCYHIQFQLRQRMGGGESDILPMDNVDDHVMELSGGRRDVAAIGGLLDMGAPLFYASEKMLTLLGYASYEEMSKSVGGMVFNTIHPDDVGEVTKELTYAAEHGGNFESTYRMHRKDGSWIWTVNRGKRIITPSGQMALLCVCIDMDSFVKEQEELIKKELTSKAMLQNMPSGYHRCAAGEGFPFLYISPSFEEIAGFTKEEIENDFHNHFAELVVPEDMPLCNAIVETIAKTGRGNGIFRMKTKDGAYRWVSDSTMAVISGDDIFYQGTIADITTYIEGMKEQQNELEKAKKQAEASSKSKSAFLFNASHDIRTPMNAIQGFTRIIEQNLHDPVLVKNTIAKIKQSGDTLMKLLNDVLELSRIESGKDTLENEPTDLKLVAEKLLVMFRQEFEADGIHFQVEYGIQDRYVLCDELKLTRIGMNLLSNAKKFTPKGGTVTVGVKQLAESEEGYACYCCYVKDTGIGMSPEFAKRAFEQFERERTSTDSGVSGSGLGLAIVKRLVDLMGGTCTIESEHGKGTTISVIVRFPLTEMQADEKESSLFLDTDCKGKRILLAEDNDFNREIAKYILENTAEFIVDEAENGKIAVQMLENAESSYYDLILMDIQMPVMDGYTAAKTIRTMKDRQKAQIPIIAMTANAFKEDKDKCLEVGMNAHIGKPIDPVNVLREISAVLHQKKQSI